MYSTRSKIASVAIITIALAGIIFPAGAIATPTPAAPTVINASQGHPVMAIPGNFVNVTLKTGVTQVEILGPKVPQISAEALPGVFVFTFTQMRGSTVIDVRDFGILDGNATLIRPVKFDDGSKKFTLKVGQKRTMQLTEVMAVGTGTLRWAPLNHYVADWQFVEETA
jgi:hypothetical protein